ncbi:hypothetical protein EFE40_09550 [Methanohalophilus halophilus]|uniref:Uncharacterized protein n=1 Tax=Methanohalophilus halophilus TaxID=2177 RepID=A0A3M9L2M9_9EURY|nr:hypothetical protein EFE40_09550 [Methanohalophilus halophilus]
MSGIHHAFSCRKKPIKFGECDKHLSPELLQDLRKEYHYYIGAFWATRLAIMLVSEYRKLINSKIRSYYVVYFNFSAGVGIRTQAPR